MNIEEIKKKILRFGSDLKFKFEGVLHDVKSRLPAKLRGGSDEYDEDEEYEEYEDEEGTGEYTGEYTGELTEGSVEGDEEATGEYEYEEGEEEEEELDPEAAAKAAQRSKIIRYIAFFGLIWYTMDFLFEEEPPPQKKGKPAQVAKKKSQGKGDQTKPGEEASQNKDTKDTKGNTPRDIGPSDNPPVVSQPDPMPKPAKPGPMEKDDIPSIGDPKDVTAGESQEPQEVKPKPIEYINDPNEKMKEIGFEKGRKDGQIINNKVPTKIKEISISDDLSKILNETQKQIEQTVEYVEPPDYTKYGRGLVYNCKLKYWACIDRPRWFMCKDNLKYSNFYGKDKECFPVNVYASQRDCRIMQLHNINTNAETQFCD